MATTVSLISVVREPAPSTRVLVNFADGSQLDFPDLASLVAWAQQADQSRDLTQQMCVAYAAARSPDLSNVASVSGKNFTFDLSAPSPIKVQ